MAIIAPIDAEKTHPKYSKTTRIEQSRNKTQNKEKNRIDFCQDHDLKFDKKTALLAITFPLTEESNIDLLKSTIEGILEQNVVLVLTGIGTKAYQDFFTDLSEKYPKKIVILDGNERSKQMVYEVADIFLATGDDPACLEEMEKSMSHGVVPIALQNEFVADYNGVTESGNAFVYKKNTPWSFFAALIRALETFKFPYDWKTIQKNAMGET